MVNLQESSAALTPEGFFLRRWRGQVGWPTLFWRDMLAVGSVLNLAASFGALALLALGAPGAVAVALHFAPVPYNLFLFLALWRLTRRPTPVVAAALAWLAVVTVV
jgi:hypothetical protein